MSAKKQQSNAYFINTNEIAFDPNRDDELFNIFGEDAQYVLENIEKQQYEMTNHVRSSKSQYTHWFQQIG